jgi:hypothetical protein
MAVGIVDDELNLTNNGYALLRAWEDEQNVYGFTERATNQNGTNEIRSALRSAVADSLQQGHSDRSVSWKGWELIATHLAPGRIGRQEAKQLRGLIVEGGNTRGEVFSLLEKGRSVYELPEKEIVRRHLIPKSSAVLRRRLVQIQSYESFCEVLETAFDWLRFLSAQAGARSIGTAEFEAVMEVRKSTEKLQPALERAAERLADAAPDVQRSFDEIVRTFGECESPADLYYAILNRHSEVQKAKPPEGKREWFERGGDGKVFVRIPYRLDEAPVRHDWWRRPYRIAAALSFIRDLRSAAHG